ncbi:KCTD13 isoform 7, partial [Pongo abelii]
ILNYLRDGSVPLPESTRELGELLGEARYYLVQGLIEDCQLALQSRAYSGFCGCSRNVFLQLVHQTRVQSRSSRCVWLSAS